MQETVVYLKKITQPEGEKKELERELSQCGWELFRMGMQEQYGLDGEKITIERNAHGKPYLPGHPQICFNIFSFGGIRCLRFLLPFRSAWICSSTAALPGSAWQNGIFSAEDQKRLAAAENAETLFFRIWTEEESYGKWRGTGLSGSLGMEKKEGFCTHFSPEKGYEGAVWAAEPVKICMKRIES